MTNEKITCFAYLPCNKNRRIVPKITLFIN